MFSRQYLSLLYACLAIVPTSAFVGFSYSPRPTVFLQSTLGRNENEWGIPYSEDLPPLADNRMPVSRKLPNGGQVTLLGSGPGDPDLLTMAAFKLLTKKDPNTLVIVDRLVSREILDLIPNEIKIARKLPGCADLAQEEIYWWAYQALNKGKHVIRLKIGDPFVFGRGGEEVLKFRHFGVEAKVVPGVSAAFSAPLLGMIPVTHRGYANQVVMCTGYGRDNSSPDLIQYHKEQTVVFLMAVGRLQQLCRSLIEKANYPPSTPVAIIEKAGCPDQRTVVGDMTNIADIAEQHKIKPPSTIVVGEVVHALLDNGQMDGKRVSGLIQNAVKNSSN
ncbi:uroporphyrin-III C-methyltransferase [Fistulifera solaris]|uniref:uroporphyrinogen-III C-methyltransferase n=1 Tax=Fistulifera solaris TaxID=1519565 RepID=A0A1Z5JAS1_FISSO|nr:uroporphyrin-III C-methyltransferase [Fistulifera solaris]|eukprot:GAX11087.1 uroporphyrin-III C-methyltransferase [Fistulifera solaris]